MTYRALLFFILSIAIATISSSQECVDYSSVVHCRNAYDLPVAAVSADRGGDYLYAAAPDTGLIVLEVLPDSSATIVAIHEGYVGIRDVVVRGTRAYVLRSGVRILDISNPLSPVELGSDPAGGTRLEIAGDLIAIASGTEFAYLLSVADPANPMVLAEIVQSNGIVRDVDIEGDYLYMAVKRNPSLGSFVYQYDISEPTNPEFVESEGINDPRCIEAVGNRQYVGSDNGLYVLDAMDFVGYIAGAPHEYMLDLVVVGDLVVGVHNEYGIGLYDVSESAAPFIAGHIVVEGAPSRLRFHGDSAYLAVGLVFGYGGTINAIGMPSLTVPEILSSIDVGLDNFDAAGSIFAGADNGATGPVEIYDLSDPIGPVVAAEIPAWGATGVGFDGSLLYAQGGSASGMNFFVYDLTDPYNPTAVASANMDYVTEGRIEIDSGYAYLPRWTISSAIVDVSNPASPQFVGELPRADEIVVVGGLAHVAVRFGGYSIYDVSDPTNPEILGSVSFSESANTWGLAVSGNLAFVAAGAYGLSVLDISDPTNPMETDRFTTHSEARGVCIAGSVAYVADYEAGLHVVDVSDPYRIRAMYTYLLNGRSMGAAVASTGVIARREYPYESVEVLFRQCNEPTVAIAVEDVPADQGGNVEVSWPVFPLYPEGLWETVTNYRVERQNVAWETIAVVPATGEETYAVVVETDDILVIGEPEPTSTYRVAAVTSEGRAIYYSDLGYGYSIDNLPPPVPDVSLIQGEDYWVVHWEQPDIPDLAESCLYRSYTQEFDLEAPLQCGELLYYIEYQMVMQNYAVRFRDIHGNWGELSPAIGPDPTAAPELVPAATGIIGVYPNPFNPMTVISYSLARPQHVSLSVYDLNGRLSTPLVDREMPAGTHSIEWRGDDSRGRAVASGTYIVRLETESRVEARKVQLIR